jgi:hypothetical protein
MDDLSHLRNTVSYCRYGFPYRKNTDLWTNIDYTLIELEGRTTKHTDRGRCFFAKRIIHSGLVGGALGQNV